MSRSKASARMLGALLSEAMARIDDLERRLENMVRHGPVSHVDAEKQLCRMKIGKDGNDDHLSPWISYAQHAGDLKLHAPPTVGQNMTALSQSGDMEQAVAIPMTWNNANPSPSTKPDENVLTYLSKVKITVKDGVTILECPDTMITADGDTTYIHLTKGDGLVVTGDALFKNGKLQHQKIGLPPKDISSTHKHLGVVPGGGITDVPV